MKHAVLSSAALLAFGTANAVTIRDCDPPVLRTDGEHPNLICKQRGYITERNPPNFRTIYASSYNECFLQCYKSYGCETILWRPKDSECLFFEARAGELGFYRDDKADSFLSHWRCAATPTGCDGILNPSFDQPFVEGGGVHIKPLGYEYPLQQVTLMPWSAHQALDPKGVFTVTKPQKGFGYSRVATIADLPKNHKGPPAANGANFALLHSMNLAHQFISQPVILQPDATYDFEMTYSLLRMTKAAVPLTGDGTSFGSYFIGAGTSFDTDPDREVVRQYFSEPDGKWHTVSGSFTTRSKLGPKAEGSAQWYVQLYAPHSGPNNTYAPYKSNGGSASVAVDNLILTKSNTQD